MTCVVEHAGDQEDPELGGERVEESAQRPVKEQAPEHQAQWLKSVKTVSTIAPPRETKTRRNALHNKIRGIIGKTVPYFHNFRHFTWGVYRGL